MVDLTLAFHFQFEDLYSVDGLYQLDQTFFQWLSVESPDLGQDLLSVRQIPLNAREESALLIKAAPYVEEFIGMLFNVQPDIYKIQDATNKLSPLFRCKRLFVSRIAAKAYSREDALSFDGKALQDSIESLLGSPYSDLAFALTILKWLEDEPRYERELNLAKKFAAWSIVQPFPSVLFNLPKKRDYQKLLSLDTQHLPYKSYRSTHIKQRLGFDLIDPGISLEHALDQTHYCILCHHQGKDSCSKGLKEKASESYQKNPLGVHLDGCPLEEKVSEFTELRKEGYALGALAVIMIDNPLVAGTGHRICNDCRLSCIYQNQDAVDVPGLETQTFETILNLPWGFEIYSLLTRWNPLNFKSPLPQYETGYKVLVAGMGPAGYTLAHYLLNEGHTVVGLDGLKIEPSPSHLSGITSQSHRVPFEPIFNIKTLYQNLSQRIIGGFGGVSEYGITARWDKNNLMIIRLLLERRQQFLLIGSTRLGSTLPLEDCFTLGFHHVSLCLGAGKPKMISLKGGLVKGMRLASDFLMALQLTGAAQESSPTNLQIRLPIAVIGGGLTAIDTATEALAYYPIQAEKFLTKYENLEATNQPNWTPEEQEIAEEFLTHARALRKEYEDASQQNRSPKTLDLLHSWGGVHIIYRRKLQDAPSYHKNVEEVALALEQGLEFIEEATPLEIATDAYNALKALKIKTPYQESWIPCKTLLIAAGTEPNSYLEKEDSSVSFSVGDFKTIISSNNDSISSHEQVLMDYKGTPKLSFFGDLHPHFSGNVVKAMASAKKGYRSISQALKLQKTTIVPDFFERISALLKPTIETVTSLSASTTKITINAPQAAKSFQSGQFFRLQTYTTQAPMTQNTRLTMESLALTGTSVDKEKGLLSFIVSHKGASSTLCRQLTPGDPVALMGPTGMPTDIPKHKTILLISEGLGNTLLNSIRQDMHTKGNRVLSLAGYKNQCDLFQRIDIEKTSHQIIWQLEQESSVSPNRPQDSVYIGNLTDSLMHYAQNPGLIPLHAVDHILIMGSEKMMEAIATLRKTSLKPYLKPDHTAICSINSPMQCMMKEICGQCLQQHIHPETKEISYVFSCANQDQPLDWIDFDSLGSKLNQNSVQEKLIYTWLKATLT